MALVEKRSYVAKTGDIKDAGSIPESGRSPGVEHGNHSSLLPWRIPWTKEPGRLQSTGSHTVGHDCSNLARRGSSASLAKPVFSGECVSCSVTRLWGVCGGMVPMARQRSPQPRGGPAPGCLLWPCLPGLVEVLFPPALLLRLPAGPPASLPHLQGLPPRLQRRLQEVTEAGSHTSHGGPFTDPGALLKLGHPLFWCCPGSLDPSSGWCPGAPVDITPPLSSG